MSDEVAEPGRIGDIVARRVNFDDFFRPFADSGYVFLEDDVNLLAKNHSLWNDENYLLPEKVSILKGQGKTLRITANPPFTSEHLEKISELLEEGAVAQNTVDTLMEEKTGLSKKLEAVDTQEKETRDLEKKKGEEKSTLEKEIEALKQKRKEEEEALQRFRMHSAEERAVIDAEYTETEKALGVVKGELNWVNEELAAKQSAVKLLSKKPAADKPVDVTKTPEYAKLKKTLDARKLLNRNLIRTVIDLGPKEPVDRSVVERFIARVAELKQKEDPAVLTALKTLYSKLDEVAAEVLENEQEDKPQVTDSAISRFIGRARNTIFRKKPAEKSAVEKSLEVGKYVGLVDKLKTAAVTYKQKVAEYKSKQAEASEAPEPKAGLDEMTDNLWAYMFDAIQRLPDSEVISKNPEKAREYVAGIKLYALEIFALSGAETVNMVYALDELAEARSQDNVHEEAIAFGKKAVTLQKKIDPSDTDALAYLGEKLKTYEARAKGKGQA